jgi:hypothetical protein
VPRHLVPEAHFELTLFANYVWVHAFGFFVELSIRACGAEAPSEVDIGRKMIEEQVSIVTWIEER